MNVHGYEVPDAVIKAALQSMVGKFTASTIAEAAIAAGAPKTVKPAWAVVYCASRIADRLLQRERAAGRIKFANKTWTVVQTST